MGLSAPTERQLFDLLAIGLTFMRRATPEDDKPIKLDRPSGGIFRTLVAAGTIPESTYPRIRSNDALIGLINQHAEPLEGCGTRTDVLSVTVTSEKYFVALVSDGPFVFTRLVGPRSYSLAITEVGLEYADRIIPAYAAHTNPTEFAFFWVRALARQRAMNAQHPLERDRS